MREVLVVGREVCVGCAPESSMHIPSMKSNSCGLRFSCSCCGSSALDRSSAYISMSSDVGMWGWCMKRACCLRWRVVMVLGAPTPSWYLGWSGALHCSSEWRGDTAAQVVFARFVIMGLF